MQEELIQDHPDFRPLKEIISKGGITYKLVERYDPPKGAVKKTVAKNGNVKITPILGIAIYEVYGGSYANSAKPSGFEVFKIRIMKGGMIKGNPIPPGEKYPSDEDIGVWGSSFHGKGNSERAWKEFNKLKKEIDESISDI